jgi:uncharacterized delta-60 repeat protein
MANLDPTFGTGGKVTTAIYAGDDQAYSVALQADRKIVVAASQGYGSDTAFQVVRYDDRGQLDDTFGVGGVVSTTFNEGDAAAYAITLQPDRKIIVAGTLALEGKYDFVVARYGENGAVDSSFGDNGKVITDFGLRGDFVFAIAVQPNGKILVAGSSLKASDLDLDFAMVRYNIDGSLDLDFGDSGQVITNLGSGECARAVIVQPDGKIVLVGVSGDNFALVRYNSDGTLDNSFGVSGKVLTNFPGRRGYAYDGVLQPDGKIVAVGDAYDDGGYAVALARYTSDGHLDLEFGDSGQVLTENRTNNFFGAAIFSLPSGDLIVAGTSAGDFAVMRYGSNGSLDMAFGDNGKVIVDIGGAYDYVDDAVLGEDGKLVEVGAATVGSFYDVALVRYQADRSHIYLPLVVLQ